LLHLEAERRPDEVDIPAFNMACWSADLSRL